MNHNAYVAAALLTFLVASSDASAERVVPSGMSVSFERPSISFKECPIVVDVLRAARPRPSAGTSKPGDCPRLREASEEMIYAVFVPRRVKRRNKPAPLVLGLHGMGSGPDRIIGQIRDEADKRGYIVVAPMGYSPFGGWGAYPGGLGRQPNPRLR